MNFSWAIEQLEHGRRVTRAAYIDCYWDKIDKGVYVEVYVNPKVCMSGPVFTKHNILNVEKDALDWILYSEALDHFKDNE